MSEGVGARREQPPVRLETVATATGLRSPATLLRGGDAPSHPSPTPRGASPPRCRGRGVAGTPPLAVGDRHLSSPSVCACLHSLSMVGVRGKNPVGTIWLPRGYSRLSRALGVVENVAAPRPGAAGGGMEAGSGVCALPPLSSTPPACQMALPELRAPKVMFLNREEERSSHPSSSWPEHVPNAAWAGGGSLLRFPSHHSPGRGGSSVGRGRGKDIADLGKLKLDQMGAPQPIVWITSVPFLP